MSETAIREAVVSEHLRGLKMPGAAKEYQGPVRHVTVAGLMRSFSARYWKLRYAPARNAPPPAGCRKRTSPISRPSTRWTGMRSRGYLAPNYWNWPAVPTSTGRKTSSWPALSVPGIIERIHLWKEISVHPRVFNQMCFDFYP